MYSSSNKYINSSIHRYMTKYINSSIHRSTHVSMCQSIHVLINPSILYINQLTYIDPFHVSMQWFDIRVNQYYVIIGIVSVSYGWIRGRIHTINSSKYRLINSCYCYPFMYQTIHLFYISINWSMYWSILCMDAMIRYLNESI